MAIAVPFDVVYPIVISVPAFVLMVTVKSTFVVPSSPSVCDPPVMDRMGLSSSSVMAPAPVPAVIVAFEAAVRIP